MTRILYCNNYTATLRSVENVKNGLYPRHHLWGIYELFNDKDCLVRMSESPDMNAHKNKFVRLFIALFYQIKIFFQYRKFDVVYAACSHQIDFFAFMKSVKLFKGKLLLIVHHPQKVLFSKSYGKIICISKYTQKILKSRYGIKNTEYVFWGPDLSFYSKHKIVGGKKYDFYSNGKTLRDFTLLWNVSHHCDCKFMILENITGGGINAGNIKFLESVSDVENVKLCSASKIMLIPVIKGNFIICGLTSLIDALAMKMPFVLSDSANLGFSEAEVKSLLGGLVYKAGDENDFLEKLNMSLQKHSLNLRGYDFALKNDYEHFRAEISRLIFGK